MVRCRRTTSTDESRRSMDARCADLAGPAVVGPAVDFLAELAGGGAALELGSGTGRIALPLGQRGVSVHGIELSPAMVGADAGEAGRERDRRHDRRLCHHHRGPNLHAHVPRVQHDHEPHHPSRAGRPASATSPPTSNRRVLRHRGVHTRAPTAPAWRNRPCVRRDSDASRAGGVSTSRPNRGDSHHYWMLDGPVETSPVPFRYVWPSELDLMAQLAGMRLHERWSNWNREPFTDHSHTPCLGLEKS